MSGKQGSVPENVLTVTNHALRTLHVGCHPWPLLAFVRLQGAPFGPFRGPAALFYTALLIRGQGGPVVTTVRLGQPPGHEIAFIDRP